jgi:hypothetical protein
MATPTKQQIFDLWKRLVEISANDAMGTPSENAEKALAKMELMNQHPIIVSYEAVCSSEARPCPEGLLSFINVEMENTSLGYPKKILSPDIMSEAERKEDLAGDLKTAQDKIIVQEVKEPAAGKELGATHYVSLPPGLHENSFAVLRAGFVSSKTNVLLKDLKKFDILSNNQYFIDKKVFNSELHNKEYTATGAAGAVIITVTNETPIKLIREGFGIAGIFSQVAVYDLSLKEWKYLNKVTDDPVFIDSRLIKKYKTDAPPLPLTEVTDPNPNQKIRKHNWETRKKCQPELNKRTNEFEVTLELPAETTKEQAKRKGIEFLLEYYDKKFDKDTVDRLMIAGGESYPYYHKRKNPDPEQGLFAVCKRVGSSPRPDGMKLFYIASPACYMNHPSLEPNRSKFMTRDEYVEKGLVKYQYVLSTDKIDSKIRELERNLKRFQKRIDNFQGSFTLSSSELASKIDRISKFKADFEAFLKLNDTKWAAQYEPTAKATGESSKEYKKRKKKEKKDFQTEDFDIEIGLDENFKVVFVTQRKENQTECEFLRVGLNCINETVAVFEDTTSSAYMFYAPDIRTAVSLDDKYPGIKLVQKFTVPIPEARPSKKKSVEEDAKGVQPEPEQEKEELEKLESKSLKTKEEVRKENITLNNTVRKNNKAKKIKRLTFPTSDQAINGLGRIALATNTTNDLFGNILDTTPVKSLAVRYAQCLGPAIINDLDPNLLDSYDRIVAVNNFTYDLGLQLQGKDLSQIGIELPRLTYSDDPLRDFALTAKAEIQLKLNETLVPVVKDMMQNLINACQGLDLDTPTGDEPGGYATQDPNIPLDNLDPEEFDNLDKLMNLPERPNLPGSSDILNNFDNETVANLKTIIRKIFNQASGIPLSPAGIKQFNNLLDVLSRILRPAEICTLLSGEANDTVLTIILSLVQGRLEFNLLSEMLNTTEAVEKIFKTLGEYANLSYCRTFTEDLTLVSLLCEEKLNKEAYCEVLQQKGFTPQECEDIIFEKLQDDKDKLLVLSEILTSESISDYFQKQLTDDLCSPNATSLALPANDFVSDVVNDALEGAIGTVESTVNSELLGITNLFVLEEVIPYGQDPDLGGDGIRRPPEIGRDYANNNNPIGLIGTPQAEKPFFEGTSATGAGQPIMENWPYADRIVRNISPSFRESIETYKDVGPIKITDIIENFPKRLSVSIKELEQSLRGEIQNKFLEIFKNYDMASTDSETKETLKNLATLVSQVDNSIQNRKIERNLVEYRLPSYGYLQSDEAQENNIPIDFVKFIINKIPIQKDGTNIKTLTLNVMANSPDKETLNFIKNLVATPETSGGDLDLIQQPNLTVQEYSFAKILSIALNSANNDKTEKVKTDLEDQFSKLFIFALAQKHNEVLQECLKSRFLNPISLDKLSLAPLTKHALSFIPCAEHPDVNLEHLKKGLLNFESTVQDVADYYADAVCDEKVRDDNEPDAFDDAIQYAMMVIFIKLIVAETVIRGLFFFSRWDAIETITDSDIFTSLVIMKFRDDLKNSTMEQFLIEDFEDIAYKKLLGKAAGKGSIKFLINEIVYDDNLKFGFRRFTNIKDRYFNLHDLVLLENWSEGAPSTPLVEEIINNAILDGMEIDFTDSNIAVLVKPVISFYESRFKTLAIKIIINEVAVEMAATVNSIFLDDTRKDISNSSVFLASNTIFDVPSNMFDIDQASAAQGGDQGIYELIKKYIESPENYQSIQGTTKDFGDVLNSTGHMGSTGGTIFVNPEETFANTEEPVYFYAVVDYLYERERVKQITSEGNTLRNICLDAYTPGFTNSRLAYPNTYIKKQKSTFYDARGMLTELGKATTNGGFVLQKYVRFKFRNWDQYRAEYEKNSNKKANLSEEKFEFLLYDIKRRSLGISQNKILKNPLFEEIIEGLDTQVWTDEFGVVPDSAGQGQAAEQTIEDAYSDIDEYLVSHKHFDWILRIASKAQASKYAVVWDYNTDELFEYIKHGVRLVYVMPHDVGANEDYTSAEVINTYSKLIEVSNKRAAIGSLPGEMLDDIEQIENLLIGVERPQEEKQSLFNEILQKKIYQIREPVPAVVGEDQTIGDSAKSQYKIVNEDVGAKGSTGLQPLTPEQKKVIRQMHGANGDYMIAAHEAQRAQRSAQKELQDEIDEIRAPERAAREGAQRANNKKRRDEKLADMKDKWADYESPWDNDEEEERSENNDRSSDPNFTGRVEYIKKESPREPEEVISVDIFTKAVKTGKAKDPLPNFLTEEQVESALTELEAIEEHRRAVAKEIAKCAGISNDMAILPFVRSDGSFDFAGYEGSTGSPLVLKEGCNPYEALQYASDLSLPYGFIKTKSGLLFPIDSFQINSDNKKYFDAIFNVDTEEDIDISHADLDNFKPKVLQSFSIIPIAVQEEDLQETELGKQLYESSIDLIRQLVWKDYDSSDESNMWLSDPQRAFAEEKPVVQKYGADPQNLVTELLDQPVVKTLSKYALSTTNLLNFAVLQEAVFPYNKDFDLNDIFARSKQVINQISSNSREDKNDWSSPLTPEVMAGWENEMDRAMSAQIPEGAYYSWLSTVLPKWILRTYLKSADPCMRDAFRQQDIYGYDDKKLPEIVFGSLFTNPAACADLSNVLGGLEGLSGTGIPLPDLDLTGDGEERCLPGIRPVPIFPPGPPPFGFFGNPFKPITGPGLAYIAMQFLTGFEDKYSNSNENIEEQKAAFETGQVNIQNKSPYETDVCDPDYILKQNESLVIDETDLGE